MTPGRVKGKTCPNMLIFVNIALMALNIIIVVLAPVRPNTSNGREPGRPVLPLPLEQHNRQSALQVPDTGISLQVMCVSVDEAGDRMYSAGMREQGTLESWRPLMAPAAVARSCAAAPASTPASRGSARTTRNTWPAAGWSCSASASGAGIGAVVGCQPHTPPTISRRGQLRGGQLRSLQDRLKPL